jgi:hypothetical protein
MQRLTVKRAPRGYPAASATAPYVHTLPFGIRRMTARMSRTHSMQGAHKVDVGDVIQSSWSPPIRIAASSTFSRSANQSTSG